MWLSREKGKWFLGWKRYDYDIKAATCWNKYKCLAMKEKSIFRRIISAVFGASSFSDFSVNKKYLGRQRAVCVQSRLSDSKANIVIKFSSLELQLQVKSKAFQWSWRSTIINELSWTLCTLRNGDIIQSRWRMNEMFACYGLKSRHFLKFLNFGVNKQLPGYTKTNLLSYAIQNFKFIFLSLTKLLKFFC